MLIGKWHGKKVWMLATRRSEALGGKICDITPHGTETHWPKSWPTFLSVRFTDVKQVTLNEITKIVNRQR